jgi:hypothetical protein
MHAIAVTALACATTWLLAIAPCARGADATAAAVPTVKAQIKSPRIRSKRNLEFPLGELGVRDALVYIRFMVSAEGKPTQIELLRDRGFYNDAFIKEAMIFVRALRFNPATKDGVPVEYGPLTQSIQFSGRPPEQQGVTQEFRNEFDKVEALLRKGDVAGANHHAEWMLREKVQLKYEFAVLQAQLARTHAAAGNEREALAAVKQATSRITDDTPGFKLRAPIPANDASKYLLPRDFLVSLLELRMNLQVRNGDLMAALKTYNEMAGLTTIKAEDKPAVLAEKLTALLESGQSMAFPAEVTGEFWSHELFHPRFTVRKVKGQLGVIHLHCRGEFTTRDYEPDTAWSVPDGWEGCVVEFYGDRGSTFELIELGAARKEQ